MTEAVHDDQNKISAYSICVWVCQYLISIIELDYQPIYGAGKEYTEYSDLRELPVWYMLDSVQLDFTLRQYV